VQAGQVFFSAPVAPVHDVAADQVERCRHRLFAAQGDNQQQAVRLGAQQALEEIQRQIGARVVGAVGALAAVEEGQHVGADGVRADAGSGCRPAPRGAGPAAAFCACPFSGWRGRLRNRHSRHSPSGIARPRAA
jgi:hypothetical protein